MVRPIFVDSDEVQSMQQSMNGTHQIRNFPTPDDKARELEMSCWTKPAPLDRRESLALSISYMK
ncbi:MAG: hypothetical protein ACI9GW_000662 [Halieaceae bacterium]|jgi:hypothetical protein